mmetsp:Transcript_10069/g.30255  ORF Transcript_10069/g.30255 Transcript_10069/m.30255 type:complete len:83 (+) Transcript_10069:3-251(+)
MIEYGSGRPYYVQPARGISQYERPEGATGPREALGVSLSIPVGEVVFATAIEDVSAAAVVVEGVDDAAAKIAADDAAAKKTQ